MEKELRSFLNGFIVEKETPYGPEYELQPGGNENRFRNLSDALRKTIAFYRQSLSDMRVPSADRDRRRVRTRGEVGELAKVIVSEIRADYQSNLLAALTPDKGAPFRAAIESPSSFERDQVDQAARDDLRFRILNVTGSGLNLLLSELLFPGWIKAVVDQLPEGETHQDLIRRDKEQAESSRVMIEEKIKEAQRLLKSCNE